jgi:nitrite reductase/ring-hydroxylating ferredoxin subunit
MSSESSSRRCFLKVLAQGGAVAGAACLGVACGSGGGPVDGGNVSALAVGSLVAISASSIAVGRDAGGVYAMTLICPHEDCDMGGSDGSVSASGVTCNCHGSRFDVTGVVLQGPARTDLVHYGVTITAAGAITVDTSATVDASVRTAVA